MLHCMEDIFKSPSKLINLTLFDGSCSMQDPVSSGMGAELF